MPVHRGTRAYCLVRSLPLPDDPADCAQVGLRDRQQVTGRRDDRADPGAGTGRVSRGTASAPAQGRGDDEPGGKLSGPLPVELRGIVHQARAVLPLARADRWKAATQAVRLRAQVRASALAR